MHVAIGARMRACTSSCECGPPAWPLQLLGWAWPPGSRLGMCQVWSGLPRTLRRTPRKCRRHICQSLGESRTGMFCVCWCHCDRHPPERQITDKCGSSHPRCHSQLWPWYPKRDTQSAARHFRKPYRSISEKQSNIQNSANHHGASFRNILQNQQGSSGKFVFFGPNYVNWPRRAFLVQPFPVCPAVVRTWQSAHVNVY